MEFHFPYIKSITTYLTCVKILSGPSVKVRVYTP